MMSKRTLYVIYIFIGILYVAVKIGFVSAGYLHLGAIVHGAIPAIITIVVGLLALRENKSDLGKNLWRRIALIVPILVFVITPIFMYLKQGDQWLTEGRLPVLIIYECFAVLQFIIVLRAKVRS
jgi:membrane protease YdiL (CAAX protease family)